MAKTNKEYHKQYNKEWYKKNRERLLEKSRRESKTPHRRYINYRSNSKRNGLIFKITEEEFINTVNKPCYYCGGPGYGLDRVKNSVGYIISNVVSCCSICNLMKHTQTAKDFVRQCEKITDFQHLKDRK